MKMPEHFGTSLETLLRRQPLDLATNLRLAVNLVQALAEVHAGRATYKVLRPANILVDIERQYVRLSVAEDKPASLSVQRGTTADEWAYLSPEQTGRMNRTVDFRTDFYSLGVILYRMFTGSLPFSASDPLEWAHCHIARMPLRPEEVAPGLPEAISAIVMKLLAKTAEERYQSASGLQDDLERCLLQWQRDGSIVAFPLGEHDVSDHFHVSQKLYGRKPELAALLSAFERMTDSGRSEFVLVSGPPACGKSRLVHELQQTVADRHGLLISGKFEQYHGDIPYATISVAFRQLVQHVLCQSETEIAIWKQRILEAVRRDGQLIVDLIPQLELLIGPQPVPPEFAAREEQYRFQRAFRRFLGAATSAELPLFLFLDDLQWADAASLALIQDIVTQPDIHHLMLVGAYRDDEVTQDHPLQTMLQAVAKAELPLQNITVGALRDAALEGLIADTLRCTREDAAPLADLIRSKTGGNPFFAIQLMYKLYQDGLIRFEREAKGWCWQLERIMEANVTDNVGDLMTAQIDSLPSATREVLKLAACLGNHVELAELGLIAAIEPDVLRQLLQPALDQGLLIPIIAAPGQDRMEESCKWPHDRVQQAAYTQIAADELARLHLGIARTLLRAMPPARRGERLFDIVNHFNAGVALASGGAERIEVAALNLDAARKARASIAYAAVLAYAAAGIRLLPDDWEPNYAIGFPLHLLRAECELLTGKAEASSRHVDELLTKARTRAEKVIIYRLKLQLHFLVGRSMADGAEYEINGLAACGIALPHAPSRDDVAAAARRVLDRIGECPHEAILGLPAMNDPEWEAPLRLPTMCIFIDWNQGALRIANMVELCLDHGNCGMSVFWYGAFGACLSGPVFGEYVLAHRYAEANFALMEKLDVRELKAYARHVVAVTAFWVEPLDSVIALHQAGFDDAIECGDFNIGNYCACVKLFCLLNRGDFLADVYESSDRVLDFIRLNRSPDWLDVIGFTRQFIKSLQGRTSERHSFADADFDQGGFEATFSANRWAPVQLRYWSMRLRASFLFRACRQAAEIGERAREFYVWSSATIEVRDYLVFHALTLAALFQDMPTEQQSNARHMLEEYQVKLHTWSGLNPATFRHIDALVSAEIARIDGAAESAAQLYEQSLEAARAGRFIHDLALAYELAARFHAARGFQAFAELYLREARDCYGRWGADGKVAQLDEEFPQLRPALPLVRGTSASMPQLDLLSIIKVSQAMSSEIRLDALLDILMRTVVENAGARRAHLLLLRQDGWSLEASASVEGQQVQVQLRHGDDGGDEIPESIINYIRRSREQVLLDDAGEPNRFANDPYFLRRRSKSLLCLPILRQSQLVGLLYLENDLVTHAFTRNRVAVLELLVSQAAVSLDNAQLFADLQRENSERKRVEAALREREARIRRLVESNIIGIVSWHTDGQVSDANDAFLQICGYSRQDLLSGRIQWNALTPAEYAERDRRAFDELKRSGKCAPYEKEYIHKNGSRVPILLGATFDEGSRTSGMAFVLDLSERRQAEAERAARRNAEAASEAKSAFLANISHELRSPLNTLLGFGRLLERDPGLPDGAREDLATMLSSGEHLRTLINQVLDLAKIEAGRSTLNLADFDLHSLLAELEGMFSLRAEESGLALRCEQCGVPRFVRSDPVKLRQVLINLLSNALKFTRRGGVTLNVDALEEGAVLRLRFEVADTGAGISADELKNLFNPFMQSRVGRLAHEGTGLGLAISRDFVRLMGGEMQVESRPGHGTRIAFDIPMQAADGRQIATAGALGSRRVIGLEPGQQPYRILVADDHQEARRLMARLLEPLGFELREAENGSAAIALWQAWQPHLIWMDMRMPVLDGRSATSFIKASAGVQAPVIIALTASSFEEERGMILAAGCDDFLRKPFCEANLFDLMEKHLGIRFILEDEPLAPQEVRAAPDLLALAALPADVRAALEQALHALDTDAVMLAIGGVADTALARALGALANEFQYKQILQLLRNSDSKGRS